MADADKTDNVHEESFMLYKKLPSHMIKDKTLLQVSDAVYLFLSKFSYLFIFLFHLITHPTAQLSHRTPILTGQKKQGKHFSFR